MHYARVKLNYPAGNIRRASNRSTKESLLGHCQRNLFISTYCPERRSLARANKSIFKISLTIIPYYKSFLAVGNQKRKLFPNCQKGTEPIVLPSSLLLIAFESLQINLIESLPR